MSGEDREHSAERDDPAGREERLDDVIEGRSEASLGPADMNSPSPQGPPLCGSFCAAKPFPTVDARYYPASLGGVAISKRFGARCLLFYR